MMKLNYFKVHSQPKLCGPRPIKTIQDCCEDLRKLVKMEAFETCRTHCGKDFCCMGYCVADELGYLKDEKFDRDTAVEVAKTAFANNPEWNSVRRFFIFL